MSAHAVDYGRYAFDVVDRLEKLTSPADVVGCMATALRIFGLTSFLITDVPDVRVSTKPTWLLDGWPKDWAEHYSKNGYYKDDPIAAWGRRTYNPFEWSEVKFDLDANPRAMEVLRAGRDFRRNAGFVVPIYRPDRAMCAVTMCGEAPDFDLNTKRAIHFISLYAHGKAAALAGDLGMADMEAALTEGEREVLSWTAAGKSAWEISAILDIAEATVVWRLKQASGKLNAVNKVQAVVNAIRTKQIIV